MTLVAADRPLIFALFTYRYLTSGLLARRCARSTQVIRRAIRRRLKPGGFVLSLQRQPAEEAAYTLGAEGLSFIAQAVGCPVSALPFPRPSTSRGLFWKHSMLVNEVRIAFDLATATDGSPIAIRRTIPEWEMNPTERRAAPLLFERFKAADGATYWHRPDCLFLMHATSGDEHDVAVFLEADRNTEAIESRIRAKYEGFYQYWVRRRFIEAFGAVAMRVLFVLDNLTDRRRIQSMQAELRRFVEAKGRAPKHFNDAFGSRSSATLTRTPSSPNPSGTMRKTRRAGFFNPRPRLVLRRARWGHDPALHPQTSAAGFPATESYP